jgi:hypothetical protein
MRKHITPLFIFSIVLVVIAIYNFFDYRDAWGSVIGLAVALWAMGAVAIHFVIYFLTRRKILLLWCLEAVIVLGSLYYGYVNGLL